MISQAFEPGWSNGNCAIIFSANKNILLHGVYLFGSEGNNYSVNHLTITQLSSFTPVVSTKGTPQIKEILGLNRCHIEADISGPESFGGGHGKIHIDSSGVTFNFKSTKYCFDGTGAEKGQLPKLIFSLQA